MVGILVSFWDGIFSGAMLVLGSVTLFHPPKKYIVIMFNVQKNSKNGQSKAFAPVRDLKACLYDPGFCGGLIRFLSACPLSFPKCHQVSQGLSRLMKDSGIWIIEYWISKKEYLRSTQHR